MPLKQKLREKLGREPTKDEVAAAKAKKAKRKAAKMLEASKAEDEAPAPAPPAKKQREEASGGGDDASDASDAPEPEAAAAEPSGDETARTVYCEGLSYEATEDEVRGLFGPCGEILSLRLPRYQDSGRLMGYCHVEFASAKVAQAAVELSGMQLRGRYVKVSPARAKDSKRPPKRARPAGCKTVFVRNLPYDTSVDAVRNAFHKCGRIEDVRLAVWNHTQRQKGFGYVTFVQEQAAEAAVRDQEAISIRGRAVYVDYDDKSSGPRASFRAASGQPWAKTKAGKRHKKETKKREPGFY
mmetsp:Transcript_21831/g.65440  ORF Transcript_21831/g.65440 Transcript_21831/m.65440 type:complete len:298 (-) Transcript_21831:1193-2086(-)